MAQGSAALAVLSGSICVSTDYVYEAGSRGDSKPSLDGIQMSADARAWSRGTLPHKGIYVTSLQTS